MDSAALGQRFTALSALIALLVAPVASSLAMNAKVVGHQLVLSGPVVDGDFKRIQGALSGSAGIQTVILRNSGGGHAPTGYQVGELFREKGLQTAVSGYCYSSCSRMFLGGKSRVFTDDYPPEQTHVGFHGHYGADGHLLPELVRRLGLKDWIIKYSDGKADPKLVERWINIPLGAGMIHFYNPDLLNRDGVSTFMCRGDESARSVFACEPIHRTALDLGVATSGGTIKSLDQVEGRAAMPEKPAASGYASIDDVSKVPLAPGRGIEEYQRFLKSGTPRAFALSPEGRYWAWNSGSFDSIPKSLARCGQRSGQTCRLYAVDDDVVWWPSQ